MNKKLLIPLIVFLAIALTFLVQLGRNAQGEDPKALESALVGQPVPMKTLNDLLENKSYGNEIFKLSGRLFFVKLNCNQSMFFSKK